MSIQNEEALFDARQEVALLRSEVQAEQDGILALRRDAEEDAWNEIDSRTDKDKDILAINIESGMENIAELTKYMRELKS